MLKKLKSSKIKLSFVSHIFIAATVITVALRSYQFFMDYINPTNGTWIEKDFSVFLLYFVLAAASILILALTFLSTNMPKSLLPQRKSKALFVSGIVFTIGLIIDALIQTSNIIILRENNAQNFSLFLKETGTLPNIFQIIFALFAALYLLLFALSYSNGKNIYTGSKILALAPAAWAISRIFTRFMRTDNFKNNSELLFELFMLCFFMLFLFSLSRISSQMGQANKMWIVFGSGFVSISFALLTSVPRLVLMIAGHANLMVEKSPLEYADLTIAAFIGILLFTILKDYNSGKYEKYTEDNAVFDLSLNKKPEILPLGEILPQKIDDLKLSSDEDDEAFKIAEQYSNKYIQSTESTLAEKSKEADKNDSKQNEDESSESGKNSENSENTQTENTADEKSKDKQTKNHKF